MNAKLLYKISAHWKLGWAFIPVSHDFGVTHVSRGFGITHVSCCFGVTHMSCFFGLTHVSRCFGVTHLSRCFGVTHVSCCFGITHVSRGFGVTRVSWCFGVTHVSWCFGVTHVSRGFGVTYVSCCFGVTLLFKWPALKCNKIWNDIFTKKLNETNFGNLSVHKFKTKKISWCVFYLNVSDVCTSSNCLYVCTMKRPSLFLWNNINVPLHPLFESSHFRVQTCLIWII